MLGRAPNKATIGHGSNCICSTSETEETTEHQYAYKDGHVQNIWTRVPWCGGHLSQIGSVLGWTRKTLAFVQYALCITVHWVTPCLAHTEDEWTWPKIDPQASVRSGPRYWDQRVKRLVWRRTQRVYISIQSGYKAFDQEGQLKNPINWDICRHCWKILSIMSYL